MAPYPSFGAAWPKNGGHFLKGKSMNHQQSRFTRFIWSVLALVLFIFLLGHVGACSKLGIGYRCVLVVRNAGDATSQALAAACEAKRQECKSKHAIKTKEYTACVAKCLEALKVWRLYVKPSVNTALASAFGVLETAKQAGKKKTNWLAALKPGACALVTALKQWRELMPEKYKSLMALIGSVEGLVCK